MTNKFDVKEDKFYTGKAGVIFGSSPEVIDIYIGKMREAHPGEEIELTLLPVPSGPGGQGLAAVDVSKESRGWAVSSISENKEAAFAVLDFMASKEGQDIDRMGFEGVHHNKDRLHRRQCLCLAGRVCRRCRRHRADLPLVGGQVHHRGSEPGPVADFRRRVQRCRRDAHG